MSQCWDIGVEVGRAGSEPRTTAHGRLGLRSALRRIARPRQSASNAGQSKPGRSVEEEPPPKQGPSGCRERNEFKRHSRRETGGDTLTDGSQYLKSSWEKETKRNKTNPSFVCVCIHTHTRTYRVNQNTLYYLGLLVSSEKPFRKSSVLPGSVSIFRRS